MKHRNLIEGKDFYFNEEGLMVLSESFLLKRGYCCQNGCKHCPYGNQHKKSTASDEKTHNPD